MSNEYEKVKTAGTPYDDMIRVAAQENGVDYDYLHKKIFNESRFDPNAQSPTGPRGLGQFTKATGRAYGLVTDDDFYDPSKSINAAARHTKDLLAAYKGDYLKTSLAYNQGGGPVGAPQLAALDAGDLSKISKEGRKYIENLLDVGVVGQSPNRKWFDGETPKTNDDLTKYSQGIIKQVQQGEVKQPQSLTLNEGAAPETQRTFQEQKIAQDGLPDDSAFAGQWEALKAFTATSTLGQLFRDATVEEFDSTEWMDTPTGDVWDDSVFAKIRDSGVSPQYFGYITRFANGNQGKIDEAIKLAKENMEYDKSIGQAGWAAQLTAGVASAAFDPLTYVPVPGSAGATFAARVSKQAAMSSAMAVSSEFVRSEATGIDAHYTEAAVGGAVVGGAMAAVLDKFISKAVPQVMPDMPDAQVADVLARHGEASGENAIVDLVDGMQPTPKDAPTDSIEAILARHGESAEPNDFYGAATRLEVREAARQAGVDDPTKMPWSPEDKPESFNGIDYVDVPGEPGAVRLADGSILSKYNPLNPKTLRLVASLGPERSAAGFKVMNITEIGLTLNRSEDPEVLSIGSELFRSPVQTKSGSNGRFGVTASDAVERLRGEDNLYYGKLNDLSEAILKNDPVYALKSGSEQGKIDLFGRRVAEAIEDRTGKKTARLSKQEREFMDHLVEHYTRKEDLVKNPGQLGNPNATSLLDSTRHSGHYIPNVYDDAAKALRIAQLGKDGLQEAIKRSWLASYHGDPAIRTAVDKMVKEAIEKKGLVATPEAMKEAIEKLAKDKAYGISHTDEFSRSTVIDDGLNHLVGAENNNFLEARNPFRSDFEIDLPDGSRFSVNDLRVFDMGKLVHSYDRRMNGEIGIMAATGKDTQALKERILAIKTSKQNKAEVEALESAVKLLTGRMRTDKPDTAFGTFLRSLNDLSFLSKNAYMAAQNFTEVAGMVTNGHVRMLMHGVPYLKEMTTWGTKIKPEQLKDMHDIIFGRELDVTMRPKRQDIVESLRQRGANEFISNGLGTWKYATQEAAARWPLTRMLTATTNYITEAGRQGAIMDVIRAAHGGESRIFTDNRLHMLSITPQQFGALKQAVREHVVPDGDGFKIRDANAMRADTRMMDLWRIGDKVADETILRPHKLSNADTKPMGAMFSMAFQFKRFVFRSVNGRFLRSYYDATKNGKGLDVAIQAIISTGLAGAFYVARQYVAAQGIPKQDREEFLKKSLSNEMIGFASLSRGNILGAPIGVSNIFTAPLGFDPAAAVRTSVLPRGPKYQPQDRPIRYSALRSDGFQDFVSRVAEQVPAAGWAASAVQSGSSAGSLIWSDPRETYRQGYMTSLYDGLRGVIPNDPISQGILVKIMQDQGMEYQRR